MGSMNRKACQTYLCGRKMSSFAAALKGGIITLCFVVLVLYSHSIGGPMHWINSQRNIEIKLQHHEDTAPKSLTDATKTGYEETFIDSQLHSFFQPGSEKLLLSDKNDNKCTKRMDLSFVKIHRAGSGSWHNMLVRFALNNDLFVALPHCKQDFGFYQIFPQVAYKQYINQDPTHPNFSSYNLFFDHAVFNRMAQMSYMPKDTIFFTQLRDPFSHARSIFRHFLGSWRAGLDDVKFPYLEYLKVYNAEDLRAEGTCFSLQTDFSLTRNFMAFSLGYKNASQNNITDFMQYLKYLDTQFHTVTLLNDLDASLLLMKRKFCWDLKDILYIHTHKRAGTTAKINLEELELKKEEERFSKIHREISPLDYILYDHFKNRLKEEILSQPPDFNEELDEFKKIEHDFIYFCKDMCQEFHRMNRSEIHRIRGALEGSMYIPKGKFHDGFTLTSFDCIVLLAQEPVNKVTLKLRQYPDACSNPEVARRVGLTADDCDFQRHIYPGYHIEYFDVIC